MTAQLSQKSEAWSARFSEPVSELVKRYTASVFFDKRLAPFDIEGSLAHAEMLHAQGIISSVDYAEINRGMAQIGAEIAAGGFEWLLDLEDVHLVMEEGVERVFPLHSPRVEKVEVERAGRVRRAKLTYLRKRIGKSATSVKEKALTEKS